MAWRHLDQNEDTPLMVILCHNKQLYKKSDLKSKNWKTELNSAKGFSAINASKLQLLGNDDHPICRFWLANAGFPSFSTIIPYALSQPSVPWRRRANALFYVRPLRQISSCGCVLWCPEQSVFVSLQTVHQFPCTLYVTILCVLRSRRIQSSKLSVVWQFKLKMRFELHHDGVVCFLGSDPISVFPRAVGSVCFSIRYVPEAKEGSFVFFSPLPLRCSALRMDCHGSEGFKE